jgi:hypothetical protein
MNNNGNNNSNSNKGTIKKLKLVVKTIDRLKEEAMDLDENFLSANPPSLFYKTFISAFWQGRILQN